MNPCVKAFRLICGLFTNTDQWKQAVHAAPKVCTDGCGSNCAFEVRTYAHKAHKAAKWEPTGVAIDLLRNPCLAEIVAPVARGRK